MRYVVASTNQVQAYEFLAPLWAMVWKSRTEFRPVMLLTGNREMWDVPTGRVVVDMLDRIGCRKHYVGKITEPYRTSVQAQAARQHVALLHCYDPDDYVLTMDVDALPVHPTWHSDVDWEKPCHVRNAGAWQYRWHTTFGFGAKVSAWREFMGYKPGGEIAPVLQANLDLDLTPERDTLEEWYFDEFLWCSRLKTSRYWKDGCQFIERSVGQDRLDRCNWPRALGPLDRYIDAHMLRPAHLPENWVKTRELISRLIPKRIEDVDQYHARYTEVAK